MRAREWEKDICASTMNGGEKDEGTMTIRKMSSTRTNSAMFCASKLQAGYSSVHRLRASR